MGLKEVYLDNFVKAKSTHILPSSLGKSDNCSFIDTKTQGHTLPIYATSLIQDFDMENEVEVETDPLPTIESPPYSFSFNYSQSYFLNVYSTYAFTLTKVEFLDIFSPPPNC